jgi:hypothetical protein
MKFKVLIFFSILVFLIWGFHYSKNLKFYYLQFMAYIELRPIAQNLDQISYNKIGELVDLSCIESKNDAIFFRYSKLNCKVCVDETFEMILDSSINRKDIYLLIDFSNSRYLKFLLTRNGFSSENVIFVEKGRMFSDVDILNQPYIFTVNESGKVDSFFIVMNEFPFRTKQYLRSINR